MSINLNTPVSSLTVGQLLQVINSDYRREVRGADTLAKELGVSRATIDRRKADGTLDGCYRQSLTGRVITFNVELCREKILPK
ncbi:MAG: DUF3853 family protein [Muribaculaceae bacterium]|nr:DUF3853 family protein [Muribaculaceae bacterium]